LNKIIFRNKMGVLRWQSRWTTRIYKLSFTISTINFTQQIIFICKSPISKGK